MKSDDFDDFNDLDEPEYETFYDAKTYIVESELLTRKSDSDETRRRFAGPSQTRSLLEAVLDAAAEFAHSKGLQPSGLRYTASEGIEIVGRLQSSTRDWTAEVDEEMSDDSLDRVDSNASRRLDFWQHSGLTVAQIKHAGAPYIDRETVALAVGDYLKLPYRVPQLERLLADMVIGMEFHAFTSEVLHEVGSAAFPFGSPVKQRHALLSYVRNVFWSVVTLGGLTALAGNFVKSDPLTLGFVIFLIVVLSGLTLFLPVHWWAQRTARKKIWEVIALMQQTYYELNTAGPVSTRRLREVAARAADAGVNWGPLFALLDDNIARGGRL